MDFKNHNLSIFRGTCENMAVDPSLIFRNLIFNFFSLNLENKLVQAENHSKILKLLREFRKTWKKNRNFECMDKSGKIMS